MLKGISFLLVLLFGSSLFAADYDIVAVKAPRKGDTTVTSWQEVFDPINGEAGTNIVIIKKDGTEEVLVDAGPKGVAFDPCPSLDGKWVYYCLIPDITAVNTQRRKQAALSGSDIYKINVETKQVVRLTNQEWTPNTGVANWSPNHLSGNDGQSYLGYGIYNTGPCPLPNGRIMFTSSRNGFLPPKGFSFPNMQLFVMDEDGKNVEEIGYLNIGSALHPVLLKDGTVMWSSWEVQGHRDHRQWGLWAIWPDGREWEPLISAFTREYAFHFSTQLSNEQIVSTFYYNLNNNGFGSLLAFNKSPPPGVGGGVRFGSPDPNHSSNPLLRMLSGNTGTYDQSFTKTKLSFSPYDMKVMTPYSVHLDQEAALLFHDRESGIRAGKYSHPSGAPNNELLAVYTPGPANHQRTRPPPTYKGQIVILPNGTVERPDQHIVVRTDHAFNYQQPKALVSFAEIYGSEPHNFPWLPNDGTKHAKLPQGTPFGLIGTSSFYKRESKTFAPNAAWLTQGSDAGTYDNSEIYSVRIVQTEPQSHLSYTKSGGGIINHDVKKGWSNKINERLRNLGEIKLRKDGVPLDPDGNPDTSFLAKIPADVPFTFQMLDSKGMALSTAQTWHQVRPGEIRHNCGGCHSHSQPATDFSLTAASKPEYEIKELVAAAKDVEFNRDVWPIVEAKCSTCHNESNPSGLNMSTQDLAFTSLSSKVIGLRSRESELLWKLHGVKTDGSGGTISGARMPLGEEPLTDAELRVIAEWVDLGAARGDGVFKDDLRPTLTITHPRREESAKDIVFGAFDSYSGLKLDTLNVSLNGTDITNKFTQEDFVWKGSLDTKVDEGELTVSIADNAGNVKKVVRTFKTQVPPPPTETCEEELARTKAELAAARTEIEALKVQNANLQQKIDNAKAALE